MDYLPYGLINFSLRSRLFEYNLNNLPDTIESMSLCINNKNDYIKWPMNIKEINISEKYGLLNKNWCKSLSKNVSCHIGF